MPDTETLPPRTPESLPVAPVSRPRHRRAWFSPVWIIPLLSLLLGLWLVWRHYSAKGPEVTVRFETAEGIIAGKTPILCRSVNIGTVSKVELTNDIKGVIITLDMNADATRLLVDDTQIWVVRARYSSAGISGLNTLVSGNYIELQPGVSKKPRRHFTGLENPPPTPPGVPGVRIKLIAEQAGGLGPGASIVYKGITVGKLETRVFYPETGVVEFNAFIEGQYARLVNEQTRFYNSGGLDLKVGAEGVSLRTGTLESLLSSTVTFTEPQNQAAHPIANGHTFALYTSLDEAKKADFNPTLPYLLLFTKSVRGLSPEAPVEFRGIRVGSVVGASFKYLPNDPEHRVPVLIKIDPAALLADRPDQDTEAAKAFIAQNVDNGLRASLKTGSLLTGQLFVELDYQKDAPPASIAGISGYDVLPTVPASGLDELEEKVGELVDKFKALPLEKTVNDANEALVAVKGAAGNLEKVSENKNIDAALSNLRATTENLNEATDTLKRQPWRLIWPSTKKYEQQTASSPSSHPAASPRRKRPSRND